MKRKNSKRPKSKKNILLENPDIARWYENTARGSTATADVYTRRLSAICDRYNISPEDLVNMEKDIRYRWLLDFVSSEEKRGMSGSYIASSMKAVRSWLAHNSIKIKRKVKIHGAEETPTLENERVPTQRELHRIFLAANPREIVCCVLVAHSGVRP